MSFRLLSPVPLIETETVLPNPTFGDSENPTVELSILRTINGNRRTYVKTKTSQLPVTTIGPRRRLSWTFRLTRNKALEVFEFYRAYNSQPIFINDHNNRGWVGWIINNPFEIEMSRRGTPTVQGWPTGETCQVTIEFEGALTVADLRAAKIFTPTAVSDIRDVFTQDIGANVTLPTVGNLRSNWDAQDLVHTDNTVLNTWADSGPENNDLIGVIGGKLDPILDRSPVYRAASPIFNNRPTVAFEAIVSSTSADVAAMRSTSDMYLFLNKKGTMFWVCAHTINDKWGDYLASMTDAKLAIAQGDLSFNTPTEYGWWALHNQASQSPTLLGIEVEQLNIGGSSNGQMPVSNYFQPVDPAGDPRLATSEVDSIPSLTPQIYMLSRDADTNLRFRINGIEQSGATITDNPGYFGTFYVNEQKYVPTFENRVTAEWGQILSYRKRLSTSEIQEVEKYLSLRWGIPISTA